MNRRPHEVLRSLGVATCFAFALATQATAEIAQWSVLPATGSRPSPRKHHTMVYVPGADPRVILYGGEAVDPGAPPHLMPMNDLWVLHLAGTPYWEQIAADGAAPPALHGHNAVYDAANNRMLLFGGRQDMGTSEASFPDGVWGLTWDGSGYHWSALFNYPTNLISSCSPTPTWCKRAYPRRTHAGAAVLGTDVLVVGGQSAPGMLAMNDVWRHPMSGTAWNYSSGSLWGSDGLGCDDCLIRNFPEVRYYHSLIADEQNRLVMFGGLYEDQEVSNAFVWTNGGSWSFLGQAPTSPYNFGRKLHVGLYDPVDDRMVVIGGYFGSGGLDNTSPTSDVTSLPLPSSLPAYTWPTAVNNDWVRHTATCLDPGPMAEHAGVYDAAQDRFLVFGGVQDGSGATLRDDAVWVLRTRPDETVPPAAVTLSASQIGRYSSTIAWTAPGDDGNVGTVCRYELRRSTSPITAQNFANATLLTTDAPSAAGTPECGSTGPNSQCLTYYYALKSFDDAGNASAMSNVLSIKQKCSGLSYYCAGGGAAATPVLPEPSELQFGIRSANPADGGVAFFVQVPDDARGQALEVGVYDVAGKRVRTLARQTAAAGSYDLTWDRLDDHGARAAAGVYFVHLRLGDSHRSQKVVIVRDR